MIMVVSCSELMITFCDNQVAIVSNPMFLKCIKHVKVDCHFLCNVLMSGKICNSFT